MNYSRVGITVMFLMSLCGLYMVYKFEEESNMIFLGIFVFIITTFVWVESAWHEYQDRKLEREKKKQDRPVKILHSVKSGKTLEK